MKAEVDAYLFPLDSGKTRDIQVGRLGEGIVRDVFEEHGFQVETLGHNSTFDMLAKNNGRTYAIEVKTLLSSKSRPRISRKGRNQKIWYCRRQGFLPLTVVLELDEYGKKVVLFIGYKEGIKVARRPYTKSLEEFFEGEGR